MDYGDLSGFETLSSVPIEFRIKNSKGKIITRSFSEQDVYHTVTFIAIMCSIQRGITERSFVDREVGVKEMLIIFRWLRDGDTREECGTELFPGQRSVLKFEGTELTRRDNLIRSVKMADIHSTYDESGQVESIKINKMNFKEKHLKKAGSVLKELRYVFEWIRELSTMEWAAQAFAMHYMPPLNSNVQVGSKLIDDIRNMDGPFDLFRFLTTTDRQCFSRFFIKYLTYLRGESRSIGRYHDLDSFK